MRSTIAIAIFLLGLLPSSPIAQEILRMPERPSSGYNFLQGCWVTDQFKHDPRTIPGRSTYCFDANGRGTFVFETAVNTCRMRVEASYVGNRLKLVDSDGTCSNGTRWYADRLDCQRGAGNVAFCSGQSEIKSSNKTYRWTVNLRRQGPAPAAATAPPGSAPSGKPQKFKSMLD